MLLRPDSLLIGKLIQMVQANFRTIHRTCAIKIADPNDQSKCLLQYRDHKAKHHEITLLRDPSTNEYSYGDYRSSNIYDMIVSTKIGQEIFGAFPQQLVAVTEEALDMPLEQQPWFFCNLNDMEISELIDFAAGSTLFITVSYGSKVYLHWSGDKHSHLDRIWCFPPAIISSPFQTLRNRLSSHMLQQNFIAGVYNKGIQKEEVIYQFYRCVAHGGLNAIKNFHKEHNIDLSQLTRPNILAEYLLGVVTPNESIVDWLLENGCTAIETYESDIKRLYSQHQLLLSLVLKKCKLPVAITLLERNAYCPPFIMDELISNHVVSFDTYMTFWNSTDKTRPARLMELFAQVHKYKPASHTNKTLIMCAWQFGNEDNYFKLIPKDIMNEIISYGLDEPEWYKIVDHIMEKSTGHDFYGYNEITNNFEIYAPYIVKNHKKFSPAGYNTLLKRFCEGSLTTNANDELIAHWITKLSQVMPLGVPPLTSDYFPNTLFCCLENELQLPMVKSLMECGFITKEFMSRSCPKEYVNGKRPRGLPPAWVAVISKNKAAVKYLCSVGAMQLEFLPLEYPPLSLQQVCVELDCEEMYHLVVECLNDKI